MKLNKTKLTMPVTILMIALILLSPVAIADNPLTYTEPKSVQTEQLSSDGTFTNNLFTGSATYSYSINGLPGINGFQPSVSLNYNHQSKYSGKVGIGWSLNDFVIYRDTNSTRSDTTDDEYHLIMGGSDTKLIYDSSEGGYKTEYDSYLLALYSSSSEQWTLKTKDGVKYTFGGSDTTKQESVLEDYTSRWFLKEIEDVHSNKIYYTYLSVPWLYDEPVLTKISYGQYSITFMYDFDSHIGFNGYKYGTKVFESVLVDHIDIRSNYDANIIKRYDLEYSTEDKTKLLTKITEYGEGGSVYYNDVEFDYFDNEPGWTLDNSWKVPNGAQFGEINDRGVRLFDINGDGLNDLVKTTSSQTNVWKNNGLGFNSYSQVYPPIIEGGFVDDDNRDLGVRFGDFNGDGKIDLFKAVEGSTIFKGMRLNDGDDFSTISIPSLLSDISFIELSNYDECDPADCEMGSNQGVECNNYYCARTCEGNNIEVCDADWNLVFEETSTGYSEAGDSEIKDYAGSYKPTSGSKCYKFIVDTPNDVDLEVNDDECYSGDSSTDGDGIIFATIYTPSFDEDSWLATVPPMGVTKHWYGELYPPFESGDFQYDYLFAKESANDDFATSTKTHFANSDFEAYCAPEWEICHTSSLDNICGYGCEDQSTKAKVQSGYYEDPDWDLESSWYEALGYDQPCDDSEVYLNKAEFLTLEVYEADVIDVDSYQIKCSVDAHMVDNGIRLADLNGDGRTDIITGYPLFTRYLNLESGWTTTSDWSLNFNIYDFVGSDGEDEGKRLADVNGDGLVDLVWAANFYRETWLNTGDGWGEQEVWDLPEDIFFVKQKKHHGVQLVDINGDGFVDILKKNKDEEQVWLNRGIGWEENFNWDIPNEVQFNMTTTIADVNGDGMPDIVKAASSSSSERKTWINNYGKQNLLKTVKSAMGGTTNINYKNIPSLDNTGSDDISDLSFNGWVVNYITKNNGLSGSKQVYEIKSYFYENGKYDSEHGEFMGFEIVKEVNEYPGGAYNRIEHKFHQDKAKKGREYFTLIEELPSTDPYQKVERTFGVSEENGIYQVNLEHETVRIYDGDSNGPHITATEYEYDSYGNVIQINYVGNIAIFGDEKTETYQYNYDFANWIFYQPTEHKIFDSSDQLLLHKYYEYNNKDLIYESQVNLDGGENIAVSYDYDSHGNLISVISPNEHETEYEYDSTFTYMIKETNPLDQEINYVYDYSTGQLSSVTDPNGNSVNYVYDAFGRKIKEIRQGDSTISPSIEYIYEVNGIAPESVITKVKENSLGTFDSYMYYGGFGRLIETRTESENNQWILNQYHYDNMGRLSSEENPVLFSSPNFGNFVSYNIETIYEYDPVGRIVKLTHPDGSEINMEYDKLTISIYDQNNVRHDYVKDAYGNIKQVIEYDEGEQYVTNYEYDSLGRLLKVIDDQNNEINYEYDTFGRRITAITPNSGTWNYVYDLEGNLIEQQDDEGNIVTIQYDDLNREISRTADGEMTTYVYDLDKIGTLSSITTSVVEKNYEYDSRLRLTQETQTIDGIDFVTSYTYDNVDRVISKTLPNGELVDYEYNNQGELESISEVLPNIDYDEHGSIVLREYDNSLQTKYDYDSQIHKLEEIKTKNPSTEEVMQDLSYEYDLVLNLLGITDAVNSIEYSMGYDDLNRLMSAEKISEDLDESDTDYNINYAYDSIGNILNALFFDEFDEFIGEIAYTYGANPIHSPSMISIMGDVFDDSVCESQVLEPYCSSESVNEVYADYVQENCEVVSELQEVCEFGCDSGACLSDPCDTVVCDNYCEGYSYYEGSCVVGECEFDLVSLESDACGWSEPICSTDDDCGSDGWLNNLVCDNTYENVYGDFISYTCLSAGTPESTCIENTEYTLKQECEFGCEDGECVAETIETGELKVRVNAFSCEEYYWISPVIVNIYENAETDENNEIITGIDTALLASKTITFNSQNVKFDLEPGFYAVEAIKSGYKDRAVHYGVELQNNLILSITMNPIDPVCSDRNGAGNTPAAQEESKSEKSNSSSTKVQSTRKTKSVSAINPDLIDSRIDSNSAVNSRGVSGDVRAKITKTSKDMRTEYQINNFSHILKNSIHRKDLLI
ncbi:hypothetical protein HN587_00895 [Candidatus Woesearchaeota archaeon]|jgi:YD repeat-containing protein|nr:hypothetical protein [Candidatus Woesearchaeota archaeon]